MADQTADRLREGYELMRALGLHGDMHVIDLGIKIMIRTEDANGKELGISRIVSWADLTDGHSDLLGRTLKHIDGQLAKAGSDG